MERSFKPLAVVALAVAACGGSSGGTPDAYTPGDGHAADAPPDLCDYHEQHDTSNDTTPEATGLSAGAAGIRVCGQIEMRAPQAGVVDTDQYAIDVPADGHYIVRMKAMGGGDLDQLVVHWISDVHAGRYVGTHAVFVAPLTAGMQTLEVYAANAAAPAGPVPYEITIAPDDIDARCMTTVGPVTYTEANDGTTNAGNDMVTVKLGVGDAQTPDTPTADAPEPTDIVVAPAMSYALAGTTGLDAAAASYQDDYRDRDTYLIATGAETDEVSIRVDFMDDTTTTADDADLDAALFEVPPDATSAPRVVTTSFESALAGPEFTTTSVLPSSNYWLWVGSYRGTLTADKPYTVTICGATFTP
jgi:hypothetical protein